MALGIAVLVLVILLTVIGGAAQHGASAAQLRRGPASVVLTVLITLAGLTGIVSLGLLFWGLVTRNRRSLDSSEPKRHSPILVAGAALAVFACLAGLLALAARARHLQSFAGLGGRLLPHAGRTPGPIPFNATASFATAGVVVGIVALLVTINLVRSMGWRRVLRRLSSLLSDPAAASDDEAKRPELEALGTLLSEVTVEGPETEPDPRRAVVACYLRMLEVGARHGPERRDSETPAEYLRRMLAATATAIAPATSLTGLFERARYSEQPVDESMRSGAIAALGALRRDLVVRAAG